MNRCGDGSAKGCETQGYERVIMRPDKDTALLLGLVVVQLACFEQASFALVE